MTSSQDTEITLGTGKLLFLFFGLVAICALFFAMGYSLGRKAEPGVTAANAAAPQAVAPATKPAGSAQAPPMTFYKAVEQKDANSELTPVSSTPKADSTSNPANPTAASTTPGQAPAQTSATPDPLTTLPAAGYFVQVAAVTKQEDADALVDALKKKQYPAFVANGTAGADKFFRVQLGPFSDVKDAEAMRTRLISDGYNPILKK